MAKLAGSPVSFGAFSDEIIIQVLHFCNYQEITRFAMTNKRHYEIVANSTSLQLHIELEVNGLEIINGSQKNNATYSLLLNELIRYRDAWLNLAFGEPTEQTSKQTMLLWELREGYYAVAFSSVPGAVWAPNSLEFMPLDSPPTAKSITLRSDFHEFTFDLEQELVVLIKVDADVENSRLDFQLSQTATGLDHPLSRNPTFVVWIDFPVPSSDDEPQGLALEIIGDILVAKVANSMAQKYEIMVWNWKTGTFITRIGSRSGVADFSFFDKTRLVLLSAENDGRNLRSITLSLYPIVPGTYVREHITTGFRMSDHSCARPILAFEFPKLGDSFKLMPAIFFMRSDPVPGKATFSKSTGFAQPTALTFSVILSLAPLHRGDSVVQLRIFIDARSLLHSLLHFAGESDTVIIPWIKWGTWSTRWFLCRDVVDYWLYSTSGSRFIRISRLSPSTPLHDLTILDFHPLTVRRHGCQGSGYSSAIQQTSQHEERLRRIVMEGRGLIEGHHCSLGPDSPVDAASECQLFSEIIGADMPTVITEYFSIPVESRLSYRVVTRPEFLPTYEDWEIGGDYIVGTSVVSDVSGLFERVVSYKLQI